MTRRVVLHASAHAAIEAVCLSETGGRETGGILLGHQHSDGHLSVTVAGDPGPRAERTRRSFHRDADHARALARDGYARARSVWIGEWHTHSHGPAHPSPIDLRAYLDIVCDPNETFDTFLSLIVISGAPRPLLYPWIITERTLEPTSIWIPRPDEATMRSCSHRAPGRSPAADRRAMDAARTCV